MQLAKLLLLRIPTRSVVTAASSSQRISPFVGRYLNLSRTRLMNIESYQYLNVSRSRCQLNSKLEDLAQRVCHSPGCKLPLGTLFGLSIATGVLSSLPQYALAERDQPEKVLDQTISAGKWDEGQSKILSWARKLWIPILLVMTVVMGWNYPVSLAVNIVFLLLSTKPTPSSIYLWVEEWRQQNFDVRHGFDWLKLGPALHVEVHDYKLLCLAQVTSINQKLTVIGILGEWWILHSSSSRLNFGPLFVSSPFVNDS